MLDKQESIRIAGWLLITSGYLAMNCIDYIHNDDLATRIFCSGIALGLVCFGYADKKFMVYFLWFFVSLFELSLYNVLDEVLHRACVIDIWEVALAILLLIYNFTNRDGYFTQMRKSLIKY